MVPEAGVAKASALQVIDLEELYQEGRRTCQYLVYGGNVGSKQNV